MTLDLFDSGPADCMQERLGEDLVVLRRFARDTAPALMTTVAAVAAQAPLRHMVTPGGHSMSAAMTCAGALGWVTDARGYRYQGCDPETGRPWPVMPEIFAELARQAAAAAGFPNFVPDACLVNRYQPGAKMGLHQDKDEKDLSWPIVSVSLGLPIVFQFGGPKRSDRPQRIVLEHGDVVVWGGSARLHYHGVLTLKAGQHPLTGGFRYNLTFRKAG
ncbi:DNA oxidative demethylase AlkB [Marinobacter halophilus]|uniref:Alpha-ketoglutarate-dependent dioxygenase AlkB n=1 Tax=Marinobacter halophilus TaxID=1323740 RepID=A0A2T1K9Q6_9GAMM|nr:DNA oxidative demethylase AlkB [Marinobacter halophilus]PSF06879.1 DNA oxidative demethylase AlkB [Marinobacter halophilus]GGC76291.1 alpha-ketoglutarate-dependent dioxygenase AlkB [Marinobacter halophilus]